MQCHLNMEGLGTKYFSSVRPFVLASKARIICSKWGSSLQPWGSQFERRLCFTLTSHHAGVKILRTDIVKAEGLKSKDEVAGCFERIFRLSICLIRVPKSIEEHASEHEWRSLRRLARRSCKAVMARRRESFRN
jgi:hypothetical protein